MPAGIATRDNFQQLTALRGIHQVITNTYDQREKVGRGLFNVYDSTQMREHSQTVGGIGLMDQKLEGEPVNYSSFNEGHQGTYTHLTYALGMRVTKEMFDDELYGVMDEMAVELGNSAAATEETLLANIFNNGFTTETTPDGVAVFSASHVREDGGSASNKAATDGGLSISTLETGLIAFRDQRDGGGKRLQKRPKILLVSPSDQFTATRLVGSEYSPEINYGEDAVNSGTMAMNPVNSLGLQVVVWDYLTDTDAWFLLGGPEDHHLTLYDREDFNTDSIYDFDTGDYKIKGTFRQSSGVQDFRGIWGNDGTA